MVLADQSSWTTLLNNPDSLPVIAVFGMIVLVVTIPVIAHYWYLANRTRAELDLKQSMVERGMSAEEIERVLRAKTLEGSAK